MARTLKLRIFRQIGAGLGLFLSALAGVTSCAGGGESKVSPCKSELSCGQTCSAANPCASGQHCGADGKCTAECVVGDSRCGAGKQCDASGTCSGGVQIDVGGSSATGTGGGTMDCPSTDVSLD